MIRMTGKKYRIENREEGKKNFWFDYFNVNILNRFESERGAFDSQYPLFFVFCFFFFVLQLRKGLKIC